MNTLFEKLNNLRKKGPGYYVKHKLRNIKNNSRFFGAIFKYFYSKYSIEDVKIDIGKDLFPVHLQSRFFFKTYEEQEISLVKKYIKGNESILELGACIGVVSCLTNKRLNNPKQHVVVEANSDLIPILKSNRDINNCSFKILNAVVSNKEKVTFYTYGSALAGSIVEQKKQHGNNRAYKKLQIDSYSPKQIERKTGVIFDTLIMDIEGGELELIETFKDWIFNLKILMIEFHPNIIDDVEKINHCHRTLEQYCSFRKIDSIGQTVMYMNDKTAFETH